MATQKNISNSNLRKILKDTSPANMTHRWKVLDEQNEIDKERVMSICISITNAEIRLQKYKSSRLYLDKIRKYLNQKIGSDRRPFEVVRIISGNTVEIREMDAEQTVFPKEQHVGGFMAHTADNYNQDYKYTSNEENPIQRVRLGSKGWGLGYFSMSDKPCKFYDYNF